MVFADHVDRENAGVGDVGVGTGVALNANGHQRRGKICLGEPVHSGGANFLAVLALAGQHVHPVGNHA